MATATRNALPEWDLSDLYPAHDSPAVTQDLTRLHERCTAFETRYAGQIAALSAPALTQAITEYESISDLAGRLGSYAQLVYATDMTNPDYGRFYQNLNEKLTDSSSHTLFFTLELNRLPGDALSALLAGHAPLRHYAPWIDQVRLFQPYQLSDEMEKLLHEKQVTGASAWVRLFDETLAHLRLRVKGKTLTVEQALHLLSDPKQETRQAAAKSLGALFTQHAPSFATIYNTLVKDKAIEDKWRHFPAPISSRNVANQVEDAVVDALLSAVRASYPSLSHRYYRLKARWLGQEKLAYWDRNAPLPGAKDKRYSWDQAKTLVLQAYGDFSPRLRSLGEQFFARPWIDVPARPGKSPGAFAHPTVPSAHPYLLLNFQGKQRDVMTLAHELGHGVHQLLSAKQGALMADTPLTLAETASVFGEQLTFQALLKKTTDPAQRKYILASKVEDMLNTVVRQIAFCDFERRVHAARAQGELSVEQIGQFWLDVQQESLGPALQFDEEYRHYWTYISHFIHSPFYVYAYAFGDCLVNALYAAYQDGLPDFQAKYFTLLEAGGTLPHQQLLAPFGLDAGDPAFWDKGLGVIRGFIDELETL